jgi:hypothetical protein
MPKMLAVRHGLDKHESVEEGDDHGTDHERAYSQIQVNAQSLS